MCHVVPLKTSCSCDLRRSMTYREIFRILTIQEMFEKLPLIRAKFKSLVSLMGLGNYFLKQVFILSWAAPTHHMRATRKNLHINMIDTGREPRNAREGDKASKRSRL